MNALVRIEDAKFTVELNENSEMSIEEAKLFVKMLEEATEHYAIYRKELSHYYQRSCLLPKKIRNNGIIISKQAFDFFKSDFSECLPWENNSYVDAIDSLIKEGFII